MARSATTQLTVITPERLVLDTPTESVVLPAHDGEIGILRDRASLMCELGVGMLRYRDGEKTRRMMIDGGFAQVHRNKVTVLTERATTADEVTPAMVSEAERQASSPGTQPADRAARLRAKRRATVLRSLQKA